jgi:hypothetical protein
MGISKGPMTIFKIGIVLIDVYGLKQVYSLEELMALGFPGNVTILVVLLGCTDPFTVLLFV